jgi:SAM-dependent methyltransferase
MGFSTEWEEVYRQGRQDSVWPWSDLVSYVMRYAKPDREPYRVLELGFGAGANIAFFLSLGTEYCGTEGSDSAVQRVRKRYEHRQNFQVECCDFTQTIPYNGPFDLVVDRSSLTHNGTSAIRTCLAAIGGRMRTGGKFIGIDWFSTVNAEFPHGTVLEDQYTRGHFGSGQFRDVGTVHFSDEAHLRALLEGAGFQVARLEHKVTETRIPADVGTMAWWNFVAVKP